MVDTEEKSTLSDSSVSGNRMESSTTTRDSPSISTQGPGETGGRGGLAHRETQYVNRLRYLVLLILLVTAIGVSVLVYLISKKNDDEEMTTQFYASSTRLVEAFERIRTERIATLASLAIAAIAHGVDHSRDWPFVSLSSFQQRAFTAKLNSGALQVSLAPFVSETDRSGWEAYIVSNESDVNWIEQSEIYQETLGIDDFIRDYGSSFRGKSLPSYPIKYHDNKTDELLPVPKGGSGEGYLPLWEMSPFLTFDEVNVDMFQENHHQGYYGAISLNQGVIVLGDIIYEQPGGIDSPRSVTSAYAQLLSIKEGREVEYHGDPMTNFFIPIFDSFQNERKPTAVLIGLFHWGNLFRGILPDNARGIDLVLRNTCLPAFTYRVNGEEVAPTGKGDLHDPAFESWEVQTPFLERGVTADGTQSGLKFAETTCSYSISVYPSIEFTETYKTATPAILVVTVSSVLLFAIIMFFVYDRLVERRQALVLQKAVQSTAIVSSLFPKNVRERLMQTTHIKDIKDNKTFAAFRDSAKKSHIHDHEPGEAHYQVENDEDGPPIADLFPSCTVLFADIAGFTAWSSTRDPSEVFTLLQNLYKAFDAVAARRRVFKVETIGDCYVAVTGLPEPQEDHAVIMCKFARDCLLKMHEVTNRLEIRLGPDTNDLSMRIGLNSGQVTGGVLRGDRARFQLFGDTVNTAARMESTGQRGRVQLSQSTADLLALAGKERWFAPRNDTVTAKGKGTLQTFWLELEGAKPASIHTGHEQLRGSPQIALSGHEWSEAQKAHLNAKNARSIDWMSEVLMDYVKQIVAKNKGTGNVSNGRYEASFNNDPGTICLDELVESFDLVKENSTQYSLDQCRGIDLDPAVSKQLMEYVAGIAARYNSTNRFHNFDHACHVTMSVHKLMKRVVHDSNNDEWVASPDQEERFATYGILASDPLTLFAIVFSALIHDVDHRGVSNQQLGSEEPELAKHYRFKSIAEQNSFDIAWNLLMTSSFDSLRKAIFPTQSDLLRFRQVVVNTVLATDIFDKEMGAIRTERWNKIFGGNYGMHVSGETDRAKNTRATIVLEHIMQASDVAHTMQHWHVYVKWNRRLFEEMSLAFKQGRMAADPSTFWYEGELSFFDHYVIPLAKKLQECKVFGVSSDEYLNYALSNRAEWEEKGKSVVEELLKTAVGVEY